MRLLAHRRLGSALAAFALAAPFACSYQEPQIPDGYLEGRAEVDRAIVLANGRDAANVRVTLRDNQGRPSVGLPVRVSISPDPASVSPVAGSTDDAGVFRAKITSPDVVTATVTAETQTAYGWYALSSPPDITFVETALETVSFSEGMFVGTGAQPTDLAVGHLDHDGYLDVVVANSGSHSLSVVNGAADGPTSAWTYGLSAAPGGLALVDLGGDALDEVAVSYFETNLVQIVLDVAPATAAPAPVDAFAASTGAFPRGVAALRGAEGVTLVVTNGEDDDISVFHPSAAGLGGGKRYGTRFAPSRVHLTHWQGQPVALVLEEGAGTIAAYNLADGSERAVLTPSFWPNDFAVLSLDDDGRPDLVVTGADVPAVFLFVAQDADWSLFAPQPTGLMVADGAEPRAVATGDLNLDGFPDIVAANGASHTVAVWVGDGQGVFERVSTLEVAEGPSRVLMADVDANGRADVLTLSGSVGRLVVHRSLMPAR